MLTADLPSEENPFDEPWVTSPYANAPTDKIEMALLRHAVWVGPALVDDLMDGKPGPKS